MSVLHLGELEQVYGRAGAKTTGDIGEILEAKYGLYSAFASLRGPQMAQEVENSVWGAIETLNMQRAFPDPAAFRKRAFASATSRIEELFRDAIDQRAFDGKIRGVPTQAALMGIRHSLKNPRSRRIARRRGGKTVGGSRPSFFDTGLLSASFRAWVD